MIVVVVECIYRPLTLTPRLENDVPANDMTHVDLRANSPRVQLHYLYSHRLGISASGHVSRRLAPLESVPSHTPCLGLYI